MGRIFWGVVISLTVFAVGYYVFIKVNAADEGDLAPEIQATLNNGNEFKLSDLRGKYVVLDFWGSWCGPCKVKIPGLIDFYEEVGDDAAVVSIALERDGEAGRSAAKYYELPWEYQITEESSMVMLAESAQKYGVSEIPTLFLISPEGVLLGKKTLDEIRVIVGKN